MLKDRHAATPPLPAGPSPGEIHPPRSETLTGAVPTLPGMPGGPTQTADLPRPPPGVPATVPDSPNPPEPIALAGAESPDIFAAADGTGPLRKVIGGIRDRREEKREAAKEAAKEAPKLPSAFDPKESPIPVPPPKLNTVKPPVIAPPAPPMLGNVAATRQLLDAALKKYSAVPDYECRLVKQEVVNGKQLPTEELTFKFRKEPYSVYMHVTGESGRGREVLYVKGQNAGKMIIVTGEGDNRLIGAGRKMDFDPDDKMVTAKSRNRIYDAGMGRTLTTLAKFVEAAEKGTRPPETIKNLGQVERKEYKTAVTAVEVALLPGDEPLLPKGGMRFYYFDNDPRSEALGLPVMIITYEPGDREVEYYRFDQFRMPAKLSDVDFSPERLGKRK